jgi:AcrR family transcriptional regulator
VPTQTGTKTRSAILEEAARLATVDGLEGLSLGRLAKATKMSKSGLYAHFGSKEELQLSTIETARVTFVEEVVKPGLAAPAGVDRLLAVCEAFLSHIEREVFPGGCFFSAAAAEVGTRRGRVRDSVAENQRAWLDLLRRLVDEAQDADELDAADDPAQVAFELNAVLVAANTSFLLQGDPGGLERARKAIRRRLGKGSGAPTASSSTA